MKHPKTSQSTSWTSQGASQNIPDQHPERPRKHPKASRTTSRTSQEALQSAQDIPDRHPARHHKTSQNITKRHNPGICTKLLNNNVMRAIVTSQNFLDDITTGITTIVLRFSGHFRTTSQHLVIHGKLRSRILMNSDRPVISQLATGLLFRNYPWFEYEEEILTPPVNTQRVAGQAPSVKTENAEYCLLKPNPATGYVEVSYKVERSNCDDLRLTLYDARGRAILERNLERRKDDLMIDISTFASGLYSVVLRCKGKVIVQQKLQIIN